MKRWFPYCALLIVTLAGFSLSSCDSYTATAEGGSSTIGGEGQTSRVKLSNKLYADITVILKGPETRQINVPARSSHSLELKSGVYEYTAGAKDFRPYSRFKVLEANRSYTLYF